MQKKHSKGLISYKYRVSQKTLIHLITLYQIRYCKDAIYKSTVKCTISAPLENIHLEYTSISLNFTLNIKFNKI